MTPFPPNTIGVLLTEAWAPYVVNAPDLKDYANCIGYMFVEVDELILYLGEDDGWGPLMDPDRCPEKALPYLAQYMGERIPQGMPLELQREWLYDSPNLHRGTLGSIIRAAQRTLTGARAVAITERSGAGETHPEDYIQVRTYASQTPFPEQVLADLYDVVPADIELEYSTAPSQTWSELHASHVDWNAVNSDYANWAEVQSEEIGIVIWDRPRPIP